MSKMTIKATKAAAVVAVAAATLPENAGELHCEQWKDETRRAFRDAVMTVVVPVAEAVPDGADPEVWGEAVRTATLARFETEGKKIAAAQRNLENARRNYRDALTWPRGWEALAEAARIIKAVNIRGMRGGDLTGLSNYIHVEFERGWAIGASLSIRLDREGREVANPDAAPDLFDGVGRLAAVVEVGWSSTSRTVAEATASLALYREVTELAAELEATLDRMKIGSYAGPDPEQRKRNYPPEIAEAIAQ